MQINTARLTLRQWQSSDLDDFAALHADELVTQDLGGPISRSESKEKLHRYRRKWERFGFGRWCVMDQTGRFLGYVGVNRQTAEHPLGDHSEVGWRLCRHAWGKGYAVEAAKAALGDAFSRHGLRQILAYTAAENLRSQSVIAGLPFERRHNLDFAMPWKPIGIWKGLVWATDLGLASELITQPRHIT